MSRLTRRAAVLAGIAMIAGGEAAHAQLPVSDGCTLGWVFGRLGFQGDCSITHPMLPFPVAMPSHLVIEEIDQAAADAALAEAEAARDDRLADRRAKKREQRERRRSRKQKQRDHRRLVRANRRARRTLTEDDEPLDG